MILNSKWVCGLACLMLVLAGGCSSAKADPAAATAGKDQADQGFVVPQAATPDELLDFVFELGKTPAPSSTREGVTAHALKVTQAILEATDRILNAKGVSDKVALEALDWRFSAYSVLIDLEQQGAEQSSQELIKKYSADPRPKFATLAKGKKLLRNLGKFKKLKPAEQAALVPDAVQYLQGLGDPGKATYRNGKQIGKIFEEGGNDAVAAQVYEEIANLFVHSTDPNAEAYGDLFRHMAERMKLVGKPIELEGQLITGQPIDWAAYRGKVVLVDFWATWCPKCVKELPELVKLHEEFTSKGFDVVGVNLDSDRPLLDKFLDQNKLPWGNLFAEGQEVHPLAIKYGVEILPVNLLVGKDGKVLKHNIHGAELRQMVEKLLEKAVDAKPSAK